MRDFALGLGPARTTANSAPVFHAPCPDLIHAYCKNLRALFRAVRGNPAASRTLLDLKLRELLELLALADESGEFVAHLRRLARPSERNLVEFMERNFGSTPRQWLLERRLDRARQILDETNTTVTDVALDLGYENVSHFISAFKRRFRVSPKQTALQKLKKGLAGC